MSVAKEVFIMLAKEKLYGMIDVIDPNDFDIIYQILKRFALSKDNPNEETVLAMLESDRIANDPSVKGYPDTKSLREALDA